MSAEIRLFRPLNPKKIHDRYKSVTAKEFWAGLSLCNFPLRCDQRLSETHDMVSYHLPHEIYLKWRKFGSIKTPQIGYIHKGDYRLFDGLAQNLKYSAPHLKTTDMETVKKSLPELLEMVGCPARDKYYPEQPTPPTAA